MNTRTNTTIGVSATAQKRVAALEASVAGRPKPVAQRSKEDCESWGRKVTVGMAVSDYNTWRHEGLTLEERLALARDDNARARTGRVPAWARWLWQDDGGKQVRRRTAEAVREIALRILERDGRIDASAAAALRDDAYAYFHDPAARGDKFAEFLEAVTGGEARNDAPSLPELPYPVVIDQAAVLARALEKCPDLGSLTLEQQLDLEQEDYRRVLAKREREARGGEYAVSEGTHALSDKMHAMALASIRSQIKARDAGAGNGSERSPAWWPKKFAEA